jgi:hypothetical protein
VSILAIENIVIMRIKMNLNRQVTEEEWKKLANDTKLPEKDIDEVFDDDKEDENNKGMGEK